VAARTPRRPSFEPIEVVDVAPSVVDKLNRASEAPTVVEDARPTLGSALRLTHDAALAWMNVLTGTITTPDGAR
jgi:hypothetical protein